MAILSGRVESNGMLKEVYVQFRCAVGSVIKQWLYYIQGFIQSSVAKPGNFGHTAGCSEPHG